MKKHYKAWGAYFYCGPLTKEPLDVKSACICLTIPLPFTVGDVRESEGGVNCLPTQKI